FDTNWIAPLGENVNQFEREICEVTGAKAAVALSAGTAALHLGLKALGVEKGDLVFCQSLTFSASANPIIYQNAVPIFIDSEEDTWNMSPDALERAFQKYDKIGKKPKAVIVVHLYGIPAKMEEIIKICQVYDVPILEDAAESLGSLYKGKMTGTFGECGVLSFNGNKIITSSGGGMLLFNGDDAKEKAEKARFWATQSRENERYYQHKELGYNYRMSNIVAGIGRGQLKVLSKRIEKKMKIYHYYQEAFKDMADITMMPIHEEYQECNCWLSAIILSKRCTISPLDIQSALEKENIEARPVWKPMHLQPFFGNHDYIDNGAVAQKLFERGLCLPSDTKILEEDLKKIVEIVKRIFLE
ncbi:MAG: DegT/DnrJ/EryC1/StrS family aminotransferase, partial [Faecalimonas umbilicata]|uniref:DegT/DnrJ/EryC1/StrS family aminotransferase n=1 Tax=Faecalimonas umbilicata TaxID=1912855 RepID=UPI0039925FBE